MQIACPHCDAINRLPQQRLGDKPRCGRCKSQLFDGEPAALDGARLDRFVRATDIPVVIDFWAPWCGPCRTMAPHFSAAAAALEPRVRFVKINSDEAPALAQRFNIRSIPTLVLLRNGIETARQSGASSRQALIDWINAHLSDH